MELYPRNIFSVIFKCYVHLIINERKKIPTDEYYFRYKENNDGIKLIKDFNAFEKEKGGLVFDTSNGINLKEMDEEQIASFKNTVDEYTNNGECKHMCVNGNFLAAGF